MAEQIGTALPFTAFYTTLGVGTTGLTVTADVYRNGTEIVAAGSATDAGDGLYTYTLASGSNTVEGVYIAVFKTATTTVDQQHIAAVWEVGTGGIENLDAAVSSRSALTAQQVWEYVTRTLTSGGGATAQEVWEYATRRLTGGAGGGATANVITINDGTNPLDGVDVWATTDSAGTNVVARANTDSSGNVTFYLDAGTYYIWKQLAGYSFTNPQTLVVS